VNEDGSVSRAVEEKRSTGNQMSNKNKSKPASLEALNDPPQSNSKSVAKGKRLKPQSEIRSRKRKSTNKN
jgi:hypothetical protein